MDAAFLAQTFELRADILRVRSSLKHLRSVARNLSRGQLSVATADVGDWEPFRALTDDAGDLYGSIEDVRDSLQALVDLRLSVSSLAPNPGSGRLRCGRRHGLEPLPPRDQGLATLTHRADSTPARGR